jgi:DNA-binding GntR family transcriptional regulator
MNGETDRLRVGPISSPTLVNTVVERLRESILFGLFAPGERIVEAELARELGISRGPVREALALLEKDGIIVNIPRKGKFVLGFDAKLVDEIYSLRGVLEPYATQLLIESLTEEKREALEDALRQIEAAADAGDVLLLAEKDIEFHNRLYELADHELLRQTWNENIAGKLRMLLNITTRTHEPLIDTGSNHRILVEAILAKERRRTRQLVTRHIEDAWRRARSSLAAAEADGGS